LLINDNIEIIEVMNPYEDKGMTIINKNRIYSSISQSTSWDINADSPVLILKVKALPDISTKEATRLSISSVKPEFCDTELNTYQLEIEYLKEIS
jgi:hypothetical protein